MPRRAREVSSESSDASVGGHQHGQLVVHRHRDVLRVAHDTTTYSNAVSRRLQFPNGLDGERHAAARRLLAPFFHPPALDALEPILRRIARNLVLELGAAEFDAVAHLGVVFAVRAASAWLGWRETLEPTLVAWVSVHRAATRSGDRDALARVAVQFEKIVSGLIEERRGRRCDDLTSLVMALRWDGRRLNDDEVVSILRNWTGGDLSSLALCAATVLHWVATHPEHATHLRDADDGVVDAAIDEMLRLDDPFVSNRRIATLNAEIGGCPVQAGDVILLDWRRANRDPERFAHPDGFDPAGNAEGNLVYGAGPHACPGRGLATRQLRVLLRAVLEAGSPELIPESPPLREGLPLAGFRVLPMRVRHEPARPPSQSL